MPLPSLTLAVVGANHPNKSGPGRRFEIELCTPGEPVQLVPEPKNPADPHAVAVFSARNIQIGYVTAERAPRIGALIREGREMEAVFQCKTQWGAAVRVAFDGEKPVLPIVRESADDGADEDSGFYPDYLPPDD